MFPECAICYVSDLSFLLPSLISAVEVRKYVSAEKADIFIFTVDVDAETITRVNMASKQFGISVVSIGDHVFAKIDKQRLSKTQTPLGTFGRFFMEELLPAHCRRLVYLDGDVICASDPSALVDTVVPEGRFAAAEDTIMFRQQFRYGWTAKDIKHYFAQLNLDPSNGYFNAGVFAVSRDTWKTISAEAFKFFVEHTDKCRHFDQSALNAVVGSRRLRLSSKWNFQKQLCIWGADRYTTPIILHFNRFPKPWMGAVNPWESYYAWYCNAAKPFAYLGLPHKLLATHEVDSFNQKTKSAYAYLQHPLTSWLALKLMQYRRIEKSAWL